MSRQPNEWRYLPRGIVRHAMPFGEVPIHAVALCGVQPDLFSRWGWLGTGNQDEYDNCAALRPCKRCLAKGGRP